MADVPFLGCKISLISKSDIRYEGILYCVDPKESTISLSKVRSYGTETRGDPANFVPPKNDVYDVIIFRASDVKDLRVDAPEPPGLSDPAIISARQSSNSTFDANPNGSLPTSSGPSSHQQQSHQGHQQKPLLPFLPTGSGKDQHSQHPRSQQKPQQSSQPRHQQQQQSHQQQPHQHQQHPRHHQQQQHQQQQQPQRGYQRSEQDHQQKPQYSQAVSGRRDGGRMNRGGYRSHVNYNNGGRGQSPRDDGPKGPPMNRRRGGMQGGRRGRSGDRTGAPRGPRKTQPLKFEGEFDFDEANAIFAKLETKFKNLKVKDGEKEEDGESSGDRVNSKKSTGQSESGSGYDSDDQNNKDGDSKEGFGGSVSGEFYDKSKSFFDNISCEASDRAQGKIGKPDWRKERQTNAETFGISANYRRGGYRGRSYGANGYHRR